MLPLAGTKNRDPATTASLAPGPPGPAPIAACWRKTCYFIFDPGEKGEKTAEMVDQLGNLAQMGFGAVANLWDVTPRRPAK